MSKSWFSPGKGGICVVRHFLERYIIQKNVLLTVITTFFPCTFRDVILHKDICSKNVVLDDDYNARLIDFGLAREKDDTTSLAGGRHYYAHPDIGKGLPAKEAWDYFAFGISK